MPSKEKKTNTATPDTSGTAKNEPKNKKQWYDLNKKIIEESGLKFTDKGTVLQFRIEGKPQVDFLPSTGRWQKVSGKKQNKIHRGGAKAFLAWFEQQ